MRLDPAGIGESMLVYFGTYTGSSSSGIYVSRFDGSTGHLSPPELAAATPHPSFLAVHPDGHHLYAVNEIDSFQGELAGSVSAFEIDASSGQLRLMNRLSTKGATPCHVTTDRSGQHLFVANYGGGSVAAFPIRADGALGEISSLVHHQGRGPNQQRQESPHPHAVMLDPSGRLLWVTDLGIDQVLAYRFDPATGTLEALAALSARLSPGSGPRHLDFMHGGGGFFVLEELSLAVTGFRVDADLGSVTRLQTISLLPGRMAPSSGLTAAAIQLDPSGRYLYASTRGADSIVVFSVASRSGALRLVEVVPSGGQRPRAFLLDPTGRWLLAANKASNSVIVFRVDPLTGRLTPTTGHARVGSPSAIAFVVVARG